MMKRDVRPSVQHLLDDGFVCFPVPYGEKEATIRDWQDPARRWLIDDFTPTDNLALRLDNHVDFDPDWPEARACAEEFFPSTRIAFGRPSSGLRSHYLYPRTGDITPEDFNGVMQIRSGSGQYTIVPPSYLAANPAKGKPADTLQWMPHQGLSSFSEPAELRHAALFASTVALLARHWNVPNGRQSLAGYAAGFLAHQGLAADMVVRLVRAAALLAHDEEVDKRVRYALDTVHKFARGQQVRGGPSLAEMIGKDPVSHLYRWFGAESSQRIDDLNAKHAFVFQQSGQPIVLTEEEEDGKPQIRFSRPETMALLYPEPFVVGQLKKDGTRATKPLGAVWVTHPRRRFYRGIELAPGTSGNDGYYNLWRGFAVEPKKGDWSLFREHVSLVAGDNEDHARYVLAWLADTVQHPERPIGVALACRGEQGTGKTTFATHVGSLFGAHFMHLNSEQHLLGRFNAHLHNAIVVLADEAVWAGSKAGLGTLKRMITDPTLNIERKGIDIITVKNLIHMIVASNSEWVVPTDFDDRRFATFDTSTRHRQDRTFFRAVDAQLKAGGLAALLYDLLEHPGDVDLHVIPETSARQDQQHLTADPKYTWWHEELDSGELWGDVPEERRDGNGDYRFIRDVVFARFNETVKPRFGSAHVMRSDLGRFLRKVLPAGYPNLYRPSSGDREYCWVVPPLWTCREYFKTLYAGATFAPMGAEQERLVYLNVDEQGKVTRDYDGVGGS